MAVCCKCSSAVKHLCPPIIFDFSLQIAQLNTQFGTPNRVLLLPGSNSCRVKIFQKRDNFNRWCGLSPLASAFLLIDENSTHNQAMKSYKKCPSLPCLLTVPVVIVFLLSCVTTIDTSPPLQPCLYPFCIEELFYLHHSLLSTP